MVSVGTLERPDAGFVMIMDAMSKLGQFYSATVVVSLNQLSRYVS